MGRSIFVDDTVQTYIEELIKSKKWTTGVIIGQVTQQKDYVVHIARTPDPVEDEAQEENDISDSIEPVPKKKVAQPSSLEQLDEKWVSTHAKQVSRMLPGGLSVIGVFALAPSNMLQASQTKLKQMMFTVHKSLTKNPLLVSSTEITDRILLQVDSTTRKLACSILDVADGKSTPKPADWKYQSHGSRWTRLDAQLSINIPATVPKDGKMQSSLLKQLQSGLSAFCESVRQSVISIDGTIRSGHEPVVSQLAPESLRKGGGAGKGGKDRGAKGDNADNAVCSVKIFLPLPSAPVHEAPQVGPSVASLCVCGTVTIRAFVPAKATSEDAVQAVKSDIVRSLYARCELLCEEDDVTEDKEDDGSVYNPPIRYFCSSPNGSVDFCDYAFEDEKQEEMLQRINELLDINVDCLENVETHATDEDTFSFLSSSPEDEESVVPSGSCHENASGAVKTYIVAAVGGLIAMVASGVSYMYLSD